jgi:hypothetical protein
VKLRRQGNAFPRGLPETGRSTDTLPGPGSRDASAGLPSRSARISRRRLTVRSFASSSTSPAVTPVAEVTVTG